jgi:hypothetical protein|nr:MAG TPA: hypothetical protein [Caudoviricetes sp.]
MEEKINIAEILKNKPQGIKLYDLLRNIDVELDKVHTTNVGTYIECTSTNDVGSTLLFDYSELGTEKCWLDGLQILLPSKGMRDWEKFSWKRGDVLISDCGFVCIFKEWASDDYTKFNGCYFDGMPNAKTAKYSKLDNNTAYGYIRKLENRCGGKLNLETLKIEKQLEFKDGDVLFVRCEGGDFIEIFKYSKRNGDLYDHASLTTKTQALDISGKYRICKDEITEIRLATEEEKQQLFSALKKKGKVWDSEHKMIVDLPKNCEFKPFDKVLVRQLETEEWRANIFSHTDKTDEYLDYVCVNGRWEFCIPYIGNESLLGTTKDVEG